MFLGCGESGRSGRIPVLASMPFPETVVEAVEVCGKCEVVFEEDIDGDKDDWFSGSPNRFYFFEVCTCHLVHS